MPPNSEHKHNRNIMSKQGYGALKGNDADELAPLASSSSKFKKAGAPADRKILEKTQVSFYEDARAFTPGTVPHSIAVALAVGVVCGIAAWLYYAILFWLLNFLWHTLPQQLVVGYWWPSLYWLWIPLVGVVMALGVGVTVTFLGGTSVGRLRRYNVSSSLSHMTTNSSGRRPSTARRIPARYLLIICLLFAFAIIILFRQTRAIFLTLSNACTKRPMSPWITVRVCRNLDRVDGPCSTCVG